MNGKAKILRPVLNILNILDATIYENAKIVGLSKKNTPVQTGEELQGTRGTLKPDDAKEK